MKNYRMGITIDNHNKIPKREAMVIVTTEDGKMYGINEKREVYSVFPQLNEFCRNNIINPTFFTTEIKEAFQFVETFRQKVIEDVKNVNWDDFFYRYYDDLLFF